MTVHQTKVFAGATMEFHGAWTLDAKYGRQFKASVAIEKKPATTASIEKYLGSGLIKGVGPNTAKQIVRYFQQDTLDIFENDIQRLTEVPGIAKKKLATIEQAWIEHRAIREKTTYFFDLNISTYNVRNYKKRQNPSLMRKIAAKVSKRISKSKTNKVINLGEYRQQKKMTEDLFNEIMTMEQAIKSGHDPLHAVYIYTQNLLSVLTESLQEIPEPSLSRFFNTIEAADDTYIPDFPPISPLTKSHFNCWLLFDISVGLNKETLTTIVIDLAKQLGLNKEITHVMQTMQDSRMGIYEYLGHQDDKILLRELTSSEIIPCISPAGYQGKYKGELWFVRILPPVLGRFDYSVVFTTPYVLINPTAESWIKYLNRTISQKKTKTTANSLDNLMKYGLSFNYWNEYIHQAYVNHMSNVIFLEGLPDMSSTRPHSSDNPEYTAILPEFIL